MKRKKFLTWAKGRVHVSLTKGYPPYNYSTLNRQSILLVLGGDVKHLMHAFYWAGTPQEAAHWSTIHLGMKPLKEDDCDYLYFLLSECDRRNV